MTGAAQFFTIPRFQPAALLTTAIADTLEPGSVNTGVVMGSGGAASATTIGTRINQVTFNYYSSTLAVSATQCFVYLYIGSDPVTPTTFYLKHIVPFLAIERTIWFNDGDGPDDYPKLIIPAGYCLSAGISESQQISVLAAAADA